jgi:hypothetical protein
MDEAAGAGAGAGGGGARRRFVEDFLTPYNAYSTTHALQLVQVTPPPLPPPSGSYGMRARLREGELTKRCAAAQQWLHEHGYGQALAALESERCNPPPPQRLGFLSCLHAPPPREERANLLLHTPLVNTNQRGGGEGSAAE